MSTPFEISDRLVDEMARANPILGTFWGVEGVDHGSWGRALSLEGLAGVADIARRYRDELRPHLDHPDPAQRLAAVAVSSELDALIADYEIGAHFRQLRHLGGLMTFVRNVFDVMPTDTPEQAGAIARRLDGLEGALAARP
jgi:hypothetical protein